MEEDSNHVLDKYQYIPRLNLYYDPHIDVYYNTDGYIIDVSSKNKRRSDPDNIWQRPPDVEDLPIEPIKPKKSNVFSLDNINISGSNMVKIIGVTVAIVSQYNIFENKLQDIDTKMEALKVAIVEKDNAIQSLHQDLKQIRSQTDLNNELINNMQIRLASKK